MISNGRRRRFTRRGVFFATLLALATIIGAYAGAASFSIGLGITQTGNGTYHATSQLAYWTETDVGVAAQPVALPPTLSTLVGAPTVLAGAGTSYAINPAVAGDVTHFWKFQEATGAPASTEIELQFQVSTGVVVSISLVTVYVETQAVVPGSAQTFTLYYDLGSPAAGTITLNSVTEISQACTAVGSCP